MLVRDLPFRIGRGAQVALSLAAEAVSSQHAELYADGDALRIRDLERAETATRRIETRIGQAGPRAERVLIHLPRHRIK